jgi:uncharacterized protein YcnI
MVTMKVLAPLLVPVVAVLLTAAPSGAHTDSDTVAVPAGGEATVTFRPTHGCAGAPTIEVSVRAPVEGATAGAVEGWQQSAEPDGEGNTILKWTGGVLADDQAGAFPITFVAPDAVGELLTFPAVQMCEGDKELAWIDGDPEGEYPAPRLLILAAGSESAATIDDVAADAPGRDQLGDIVDVDNPTEDEPAPTTSEAAEPSTSEVGAPSPTEAPAEEEAAAPTTDAGSSDSGDGGSGGVSVVALVLVGLGAVAVAGYMVVRRRSQAS